MKKFEIDFEGIYNKINLMELKIHEDPLSVGGAEVIQKGFGVLQSYMDVLSPISRNVVRKLGDLKSMIKIQRSKLKILSNPTRYKNKQTCVESNDSIVDCELLLDELNQMLDPLQALNDVLEAKLREVKNKESILRAQWKVMEKEISIGRTPKSPSYSEKRHQEWNDDFYNKESNNEVQDYLENL